MSIAISGGTYEQCPEGEGKFVLADIVDLGMVTNEKFKKTQHKVVFVFLSDKTDERGLPFLIFQRYTASLHEKSKMFQDLKRWYRGADFTKAQAALKKDLEVLLGRGARLDIVHNEVGTKVYANIDMIKPLDAKDTPKIHPDFVRKKDRGEGVGPFGKLGGGEASDPEDHAGEAEDF